MNGSVYKEINNKPIIMCPPLSLTVIYIVSYHQLFWFEYDIHCLSALGLTECLCVCVVSDVSVHRLFLKTSCWPAIYPVITELLFTQKRWSVSLVLNTVTLFAVSQSQVVEFSTMSRTTHLNIYNPCWSQTNESSRSPVGFRHLLSGCEGLQYVKCFMQSTFGHNSR